MNINDIHGTYIETFAGGAAIGLKLLFSEQVEKIVINDYDKSIYSVWEAILKHPDYLIDCINSVPFDYYHETDSEESLTFWKKQRSVYFSEKNDAHSLPGAFATLFLNRTNRSGIITGGPLGGWTQEKTKLGARFNKSTLIKKIEAIYEHRDSITISNEDAVKLIPKIQSIYEPEDTFIFFDPPYYDQGGKLYYSSLEENDHSRIAEEILALKNYYWIVTYDHNPIIRQIYLDAPGRFEYKLRYSANNRGSAPEYLFGSKKLKMESISRTVLTKLDD